MSHLTACKGFRAPLPQVNLSRGRQYVRRLVMHVRRTLEPDRPAYRASAYLVSHRESVGLRIGKTDDESGIWFDAQHFEVLAGQALERYRRGEHMRDLGNAALDLYQGPFLPQDLYQDWLRPARHRYHFLWSTVVKRLAGVDVSDRQLDQAHLLLGKVVEAAPDDEDAVFCLMIVSAARGMRVEALRSPAACCWRRQGVTSSGNVGWDLHADLKQGTQALRLDRIRSVDSWEAGSL